MKLNFRTTFFSFQNEVIQHNLLVAVGFTDANNPKYGHCLAIIRVAASSCMLKWPVRVQLGNTRKAQRKVT